MLKKLFVSFLIISLFSITTPISMAENSQLTLQEFLNSTESIEAKFTYPNFIASNYSTNKKKLPAHTPIIIRSNNTITTRDIVDGETVSFTVVNNVKDQNNNTLIRANSPVQANINFKRNGLIGKSGELTISDFHVLAVDGTYIPLSSSISAKPEDKMVLSIVLSVLICPLFLLMKGDNAELQAGTTKTVYTVTDCYINTNNL